MKKNRKTDKESYKRTKYWRITMDKLFFKRLENSGLSQYFCCTNKLESGMRKSKRKYSKASSNSFFREGVKSMFRGASSLKNSAEKHFINDYIFLLFEGISSKNQFPNHKYQNKKQNQRFRKIKLMKKFAIMN